MAIIAYTGLPGHGKSYGAVKHTILPALESGRFVATNIPLADDLDKTYPGQIQRFQTSDIEGNADWFESALRPGSVLVFDEVWRIWPAGLKATVMLQQHKTFLAEHRHIVGNDGHSTEIVLIVQRLSNLASFCRNLIEYTYVVQKLETVGSTNRYRVDIYEGAARDQPNKKYRIREEYGRFDQKIFALYKSHTRSETAGKESKPDNRANILKSPAIWFGGILILLLMMIVVYMAPRIFPSANNMEVATEKQNNASGNTKQNNHREKQPVRRVKPNREKPIDGILQNYNDGYISLFMRIGRNVEYTIKLQNGEDWVDLTHHQIIALGARVTALDRCLVLVETDNITKYYTCRKEKDRDEEIF